MQVAEGNLISAIRNNCIILHENPDPPAKHNRCILIRAAGGTMDFVGGSIPPFQKVAVWPFDVII